MKTYGCGGSERTFAEDLPGAGSDPVAWESQSFSVSGSTPIAQENRIEVALANVASVAIDGSIGGACIKTDEPLGYRVVINGPATITVSGYRVLHFSEAGTYDGTVLPEPGATAALAGAAALLAALARRKKRQRA